jgi:hypothetical protein
MAASVVFVLAGAPSLTLGLVHGNLRLAFILWPLPFVAALAGVLWWLLRRQRRFPGAASTHPGWHHEMHDFLRGIAQGKRKPRLWDGALRERECAF